jgi:acetyltransferase-like isoleucine patch superfamily enzyme
MVKRSANRRQWVQHDEEPMRVSPAILARCRIEIEPRWKAILRKIVLPFVARWLRIAMIGEGVHWAKNARVAGLRIGHFSSFGHSAEFFGPVVIGDLTLLSTSVQIIGQDHGKDNVTTPMRIAPPLFPRQVTVIEADCWIGSRVTIMEGVRIGRGAVVGAGSIVTRDVPPYCIALGSPARVVKRRFSLEEQARYDQMLYGTMFKIEETESEGSKL